MSEEKKENRREFVVEGDESGTRLDRFLAERVPDVSRMRIQALIREGLALMNGERARPRDLLRRGDHVALRLPVAIAASSALGAAEAGAVMLPVLFEDDDLLVLNKPAGISVHSGAGERSGTLVDALRARGTSLSGAGDAARPGIVHRLDKQTSGCLVVAKTDVAHIALAKQFAARSVEKIYLALVAGTLRRGFGTIEAAIARHRVHRTKMAVAREGGRAARTDFRVVRSGPAASLLECRLHSGRTHQIRVHLQHLGHPILGDTVYGGRRGGNFPRQMLHAWKLAFDHPRTATRLHFEAPLPDDFDAAMRQML